MRTNLKRGLLGIPAVVLLALALTSAGPAHAQQADTDVVAQRGDMKLTVADIRTLLDQMDPGTRMQLKSNPAALANFTRERLLRMTLLAEAKAKGIDQLPDVIARGNDARDGVVVGAFVASLVPPDPSFPSQSEIEKAYEANKAKFMLPKQYHLGQIAYPVPPGQPQTAADDAKRHAIDARALAMKPKADFLDVGRKLAQDHAAPAVAGDLGWIREDQLQPSLRSAVASLGDNAVSEPLQTQSAWVVLKLLGTRPPGPAPLADVQDQIAAALRQGRAQQASQAYVAELLRKQPIELNEIDLARKIAPSHAP